MSNENNLVELGQSDLVATIEGVAKASIKKADALSGKKYTPESRQNGNLVKGLLNAWIHATRAKASIFKMVGTEEKISAIKSQSKVKA